MLQLSNNVSIADDEIQMSAIRAQGKGGQHVNKVSTAIHCRFDINASSLPEYYKQRLLSHNDHHITKDGLIIIKAQNSRSQEQNREAALLRLKEIILTAITPVKRRIASKPKKSSIRKRLDNKNHQSGKKSLRKKVIY